MDRLRIDKWLWAARFFRTRALARDAIKGGKVQIEGVLRGDFVVLARFVAGAVEPVGAVAGAQDFAFAALRGIEGAHALEGRLGVKLFVRSHTGLQLTADGSKLYVTSEIGGMVSVISGSTSATRGAIGCAHHPRAAAIAARYSGRRSHRPGSDEAR